MIRLLAVDDSALMRRLLGQIFAAEGDVELHLARSGEEALALLPGLAPDVVTLDVEMPGIDGLACLDRIMVERPCPVVMLSGATEAGAGLTLEALERGAVDFVRKPGGAISLALDAFGPALVATVRAAATVKPRGTARLAERVRLRLGRAATPARPPAPAPRPARDGGAGPAGRLVLIGTSTGGPAALDAVLPHLPAAMECAVVVAQHMPASFTATLAARLDRACAARVSEAAAPTRLLRGNVYVAKGEADALVSLRPGGPVVMPAPRSAAHRWHPSVDRLVDSAAAAFPAPRLLGVLMTGMGDDGAAAMARLRLAGGRTIAEAEESAVVWGMPGSLVRAGGADEVVPLDAVADRILAWLG